MKQYVAVERLTINTIKRAEISITYRRRSFLCIKNASVHKGDLIVFDHDIILRRAYRFNDATKNSFAMERVLLLFV